MTTSNHQHHDHILSSSSPSSSKRRGLLNTGSQLNYYLEQLNLLLPDIHLQWLNTKSTVALIDVSPVSGSYQVLVQTSTQEQMIQYAAVLVRVLKRALASRFRKYQEKLEKEKEGRRKFSINFHFF